jgi:Putative abortive phage resistance protein AbiGi, antitoxin
MDIRQLLNRRSDLSTFLVHLTRRYKKYDPRENLESIIESGVIEARSDFGHLKRRIERGEVSDEDQQAVCFTETPLEFAYVMVEKIEGRLFRFSPYGIAITKRIARCRGVNPLWYVDMTQGHDWLTQELDELAELYLRDPERMSALKRIFPFVEHMDSGERLKDGGPYRKEFWWEREWRHVGNFKLPKTLILLCPEDEIDDFRKIMERKRFKGQCIDPCWSLEKIIARLAGFDSDEIEAI